jgi:hypothetical protein
MSIQVQGYWTIRRVLLASSALVVTFGVGVCVGAANRSVANLLAVEDLFLAGAGLGMGGGYLLAKGLLVSPKTIGRMSMTFVGFNPTGMHARLKDRRATRFGIWSLIFGFVLQVVGFFVGLAFPVSLTPSLSRALVGLGCAIAAVVIIALAHRVLEPLWYRRGYKHDVVEIASYDDSGNRQDRPFGATLWALGKDKWPPREGESHSDYAKRVWCVAEINE